MSVKRASLSISSDLAWRRTEHLTAAGTKTAEERFEAGLLRIDHCTSEIERRFCEVFGVTVSTRRIITSDPPSAEDQKACSRFSRSSPLPLPASRCVVPRMCAVPLNAC